MKKRPDLSDSDWGIGNALPAPIPSPRPADLAIPEHLAEGVRELLEAEYAENTRRAYAGDLKRFEAWCRAEGRRARPATPATLTAYVQFLRATGKGVRTIERAVSSISVAHHRASLPSPRLDPGFHAAMAGLRRLHGAAPEKKEAILREDLTAMVGTIEGNGPRALRDRAMLLTAWTFALRREEVVAIETRHLRFAEDGLVLFIPRSKTDPTGEGVELFLPGAAGARTIAALRAVSTAAGPVFTRLGKPEALTDQAVNELVKRTIRRLDRDAAGFGGHSLRSGCITQMSRDGIPFERIMEWSRHKSFIVAKGYIQRARGFADSPMAGLKEPI